MLNYVLNQRMRVDPTRITGQFTTILVLDADEAIDDQIEEVRKNNGSLNDDGTMKDLAVIDCYAFFTDQHGRLCCCLTLHMVKVVDLNDGQPWSGS